MPQIPIVGPFVPSQSPQSVVRADPHMNDARFAAAESIGRAVEGIGQNITDFQIRKQEAVNEATIVGAGNALQVGSQQFQQKLADPKNPENSDETTYQPRLADHQEQVIAGMGIDKMPPSVQRRVNSMVNNWKLESSTQVNNQVVQMQVQKATANYSTAYDIALKNGDAPKAVGVVDEMARLNLVHPEEAAKMRIAAPRMVDHYQASSLIDTDPIAADEALKEKDADGHYTNYTHLDPDSRLRLMFDSARMARNVRTETATDLWSQRQAYLQGNGPDVNPDDVNKAVQERRLSPAAAKAYLSAPKPEFDADKFAALRADILSYDPSKDASQKGYSELMGRLMSGDFKGPAATDAKALLDKQANPQSAFNSEAYKGVRDTIEKNFDQGTYGAWKKGTGDNEEVNQGARAQALLTKSANLAKLHAYYDAHPNADELELQKFVNNLHTNPVAVNGAKALLKDPSVLPANAASSTDADKLKTMFSKFGITTK